MAYNLERKPDAGAEAAAFSQSGSRGKVPRRPTNQILSQCSKPDSQTPSTGLQHPESDAQSVPDSSNGLLTLSYDDCVNRVNM